MVCRSVVDLLLGVLNGGFLATTINVSTTFSAHTLLTPTCGRKEAICAICGWTKRPENRRKHDYLQDSPQRSQNIGPTFSKRLSQKDPQLHIFFW
jgi:hypothetical protein